jgi:hypothetical protein
VEWSKSIAQALRDIDGVVVTADEPEGEFGIAFAESPEPAEDAPVVEGLTLASHIVPAVDSSGFTHFADGAQFSRSAYYEGSLPGRYAFLNAAVAERRDREIMDVVVEATSQGIFAPWGMAAAALQEAFRGELELHAVSVDETDGMASMVQKVANAISIERSRIEHAACLDWMRSGVDGRLLVDGSIGQLFAGEEEREAGSLVGLVKSHRKQYFTKATAAAILGLKEGERSSVFVAQTRRRQDAPTHSWYLRLRSDPHRQPAFGLVRVEVPPGGGSVEAADEISGWILAERSPVSLPDLRFDRLLYPIRAVEMLLKCRHPSRASIQALIGA